MFEGVNPNAITAAGVALVALSGISSTAGLGPGAVGIGGAILAGVIKNKKNVLLLVSDEECFKIVLKLHENFELISRKDKFKTLKNLLSKAVTYLHATCMYQLLTEALTRGNRKGHPFLSFCLRQDNVVSQFLNISKCSCPGREVMNSMNRCGEGCCRMNNRCCQLVPRRGIFLRLSLYFWCHCFFIRYDGLSKKPQGMQSMYFLKRLILTDRMKI